MEIPEQKNCTIFSALIETIHNKDQKKLRFAKCPECGRLNPFRLISITGVTIKCKKCGNEVSIRT